MFLRKLLFVLLCISLLIITIGLIPERKLGKLYGLFQEEKEMPSTFNWNDYLLFRKNGKVGVLRYHEIKEIKKIERDFKKYATWTDYTIKNDSIIFEFDSIFRGFSTMSYEVFGKTSINTRPTYERRKLIYRGVIYEGGMRFKVFNSGNATYVDPFLGGVGRRNYGNDTLVLQSFSRCMSTR